MTVKRSVRLTQEQDEKISQLINKFPEHYKDRSDFIKKAVDHLLEIKWMFFESSNGNKGEGVIRIA